ncbi:hypothetical protein BDZ45DRAFT_726870 [Acephala macrosclerotiorum]|nr:hypothetical protein BDZ45DRAFT_726870 [Acephala macrosclerotiorum]
MPPKNAASQSQPLPLTQLAGVYSHPTKTSGNKVLQTANERKSGLTPVYPPKELTKTQQRYFKNLAKYQRDRFHGFTTAELRNLESLAPYYEHCEDPFRGHLSQLNYIHPVFRRPRWTRPLPKHMAFFPFGNKRDGFWDASNNVVWKLLEPGIKLASQTLLNAHTWLW